MKSDDVPCYGESRGQPSAKLVIRITQDEDCRDIPLPAYETPESSGMDLRSKKSYVIEPGASRLVETGIKIILPPGYEAQVRPRSGLALKKGVTVLNTPGTVDSDYRSHVGVIIINHGDDDFQISKGDRIAQLVICPVVRAALRPISEDEYSSHVTSRGVGGFGHTGVA